MTDFQVGDRVSVEGVVTQLWPDAKPGPLTLVRVVGEGYEDDSELWFADQALTLVDRPRRKLRVGSVWERRNQQGDHRWMVVDDEYVICLRKGRSGHREKLAIDRFDDALGDPTVWREVPVEDLEAEANA